MEYATPARTVPSITTAPATAPGYTMPPTTEPADTVSPTALSPTSLSVTVEPSTFASSSQQGWKIKIRNADGTTNELDLEPNTPVDLKADDALDNLEKGDMMKSPPPPMSGALRAYLIVQYCLNTLLALCIIALMALTLVKFNSSKNVPGAWPANPVLSPTFLMLIVAVINCLFDAVNLLAQCCGARAIKNVGTLVVQVHKATAVVATVGPAVAAGIAKFGFDAAGQNDLWGWSCSNAADAHTAVNSSNLVCSSNGTAVAFQVVQVAFQILSFAVPAYSKWRFAKMKAQAAGVEVKAEKVEKPDTRVGDEEAAAFVQSSKAALVAITPA